MVSVGSLTFTWALSWYVAPGTIPATSCAAPPAAAPTRKARNEPDAPAPSTTCELLQFTQSVIPASKSELNGRLAAAARNGAGDEVKNLESPPPQALSATAKARAFPAARMKRERVSRVRISLISCP